VSPTALPAPRRRGLAGLLLALLIVLLSARAVSSTVIEYQWWKEMGQVSTWLNTLLYGVAPKAAASLAAFLVLWIAHARSLRAAGVVPPSTMYRLVAAAALLGLSVVLGTAAIDTWTVVRYFGSRQLPAESVAWHDPVFGRTLAFYLFDLPFYSVLRRYLLGVSLVAALLYGVAGRFHQIRERLPEFQQTGEIDLRIFRLRELLDSAFLRGAAVVFLLALAFRFWLRRFELVWNDHGFMTGVDYVDEKIALPLLWLVILACPAAAVLLWLGRWKLAGATAVTLALYAVVPPVVSRIYVRPNEIAIQRPYIERHIQATRSAFGLTRRTREMEFAARLETRIDTTKHKPLLDNVRLWDWRAFHDTTTQIQALRPYYVFPDTDVDRYMIDGQLRQVLLSPRELDIRQIAEARTRWPISHFFYTHGFGMVMAEANRITTEGLPEFFVQDAPPRVKTKSLKLTRPEIYYGETVHEPVFVRTGQEEFNYPSGNENVLSRYDGTGGFPISSLPLRLAAAVAHADPNILLTTVLSGESRMMIRRNVSARLRALAGFITWDPDPYLVLSDEGRLMWTVDGYTTSSAHPYSRSIRLQTAGEINYMRNAVKATVDAYSGQTRLYIFDPSDPIIQAYQRLFPTLFQPASAMPADLRRHARYPEVFFRAQAEIYRTYHMTDPQAFYNKEDIWDLGRSVYGQEGRPQAMAPTYVVAALPGEERVEFLLILPFTPRNKDNLIGLMVARCDGDNLGELLFLQLSKQTLILGPMQVEARINQDQDISKDLTLWNQQGSQVLRGQMLVLPVEDTFLYVEPIYIQAAEGRMPQLKKVVLAMGNSLIYRDTYAEALQELTGLREPGGVPPPAQAAGAAPEAAVSGTADPRLGTIRRHLLRYRELVAQGKWVDAGKELEAVQQLLDRR